MTTGQCIGGSNVLYRPKMFYRCVIAYDVDGTLAGYGGCVTKDMIERERCWGCVVGLVTGRGDHREIATRLGLDFSFQYVYGHTFRLLRCLYPRAREYVYVADNIERKNDALGHGFRFMTPGEYCGRG